MNNIPSIPSLKVGDKVRHRNRGNLGIGEIEEISSDGSCRVVFPTSTFSGVALQDFVSVEEELRIQKQQSEKQHVIDLLIAGEFSTAKSYCAQNCSSWWKSEEFNKELDSYTKRNIQSRIIALLNSEQFDAADRLYKSHCMNWWSIQDYGAEKERAKFKCRFVEAYSKGTLADLDLIYNSRHDSITLPINDFISLKLPKLRKLCGELSIRLDAEQEHAIARPEQKLLIKARAGSGKTRTLCARAALSIKDEGLNPNQVMILAFNKLIADDIKDRIKDEWGIHGYENARTFHSLAYQLEKSKKKLLFNKGEHPSRQDQSNFVQRSLERILNPALKDAMVEFFRKELEQIENIGRDLSPQEYLAFRRSLELVALDGKSAIKSNGEKFIADFLFENGIVYSYERAWLWKSDFLDGAIYKPDFSITSNGSSFILEHWAINPNDQHSTLPEHWNISTQQYRNQIIDKRRFWQSKGIPLLETHTGLMLGGRLAFEENLKSILEHAGIRCQRLPQEEITRRVFENDFTITKMTELFLQYIQRAKKRDWSVDDVAARISSNPDKEPRARLFHRLALHAYREYERMLNEQAEPAMDFDDLLSQAVFEVESHGRAASIHLGGGERISIGEIKWILLDEYQDFSELYFKLIRAIVKANPAIRLVAVGDDWQAINAFAGAELRFFDQFSKFFESAETVSITTNYRSDLEIVAAGNQLMHGRGMPAKSKSPTSGVVEKRYLSDVWIEFRKDAQFQKECALDKIFLPARSDGGKPSELALRQAQALKLCTQIILGSPVQETLLLARTGRVYGMELQEFKDKLITLLSYFSPNSAPHFQKNILAMTAHSSKGQESSQVIVLDVTQRQFPKIHPDNLLFNPFGVTPESVLAEERRLFYVAITRSKHSIHFLTEKGAESPFLEALSPSYVSEWFAEKNDVGTQKLSSFARSIKDSLML